MEVGFFAFDEVPFAPGESPFHCKGVLYNDLYLYLDAHMPGGHNAVFERFKDSRLRPFLMQRIVNVGWYDVFPLVSLQRAAAQMLGVPYIDMLRAFTKWTFPRQVYGIYKFLLKLTTPDMMARSLGRTAVQFYDFIKVDVEHVRPGLYRSRGSNIPAMLATSYMASTEVGVVMLLEISGAKGIRHRWLAPVDDGEAHGIKLTAVTREISWDR